MEENRYGEECNFTIQQTHEIIDYIDERLCDEFTQTDFQNELVDIKKMVDLKCEEIANEMAFHMYEWKNELEKQFNMKAKRSFWNWWK